MGTYIHLQYLSHPRGSFSLAYSVLLLLLLITLIVCPRSSKRPLPEEFTDDDQARFRDANTERYSPSHKRPFIDSQAHLSTNPPERTSSRLQNSRKPDGFYSELDDDDNGVSVDAQSDHALSESLGYPGSNLRGAPSRARSSSKVPSDSSKEQPSHRQQRSRKQPASRTDVDSKDDGRPGQRSQAHALDRNVMAPPIPAIIIQPASDSEAALGSDEHRTIKKISQRITLLTFQTREALRLLLPF